MHLKQEKMVTRAALPSEAATVESKGIASTKITFCILPMDDCEPTNARTREGGGFPPSGAGVTPVPGIKGEHLCSFN